MTQQEQSDQNPSRSTLRYKLNKISHKIMPWVIVLSTLWGFYSILSTIWRALVKVNPTLAVGVVAAVATTSVSILSLVVTKYFEIRSSVNNEHIKKKIPIYEELIGFIFKLLKSVKTETALDEKEILDSVFDLNQKLTIWGSDEVITAFSNYRASIHDPLLILLAVENLMLAIRKDIGHKNKNLNNGRLLSIFINDAHLLYGSKDK